MRFIYPQSILTPRLPDELFQAESTAMSQAGHLTALIDSQLLTSTTKIKPPLKTDEVTIYRGWMLSQSEYENYVQSVMALGGIPFTSTEQYLSTHHLPNWYHKLADLTPETVILPLEADWVQELTHLGWARFFIKDYVKSLKTSMGSILERPEDIHQMVAEMQKYRGMIEGGLCVRQVEEFLTQTEQRYFVIKGKPYGAKAEAVIPEIVFDCASRIPSPFFSLDVIQRRDGQLRVVEIGDGQVSDLVGWSIDRFIEIWNIATNLD